MNKMDLILKYYGDRDQFELVEDISYKLSNGKDIIVPKGYVTDMASTPRIVWSIFPPFGKYGFASVIHDYLYETPEIIVSRRFVDAEFKRIMISNGVSKLVASIFYIYVYILGGINWKKFKKR
jgi:hypothetical protein